VLTWLLSLGVGDCRCAHEEKAGIIRAEDKVLLDGIRLREITINPVNLAKLMRNVSDQNYLEQQLQSGLCHIILETKICGDGILWTVLAEFWSAEANAKIILIRPYVRSFYILRKLPKKYPTVIYNTNCKTEIVNCDVSPEVMHRCSTQIPRPNAIIGFPSSTSSVSSVDANSKCDHVVVLGRATDMALCFLPIFIPCEGRILYSDVVREYLRKLPNPDPSVVGVHMFIFEPAVNGCVILNSLPPYYMCNVGKWEISEEMAHNFYDNLKIINVKAEYYCGTLPFDQNGNASSASEDTLNLHHDTPKPVAPPGDSCSKLTDHNE
jgi:hypothetical protein